MKATCEICGAEIPTNEPNFFTLFGQRACRARCMQDLYQRLARVRDQELYKRQAATMAAAKG